MFMAFWPTSHFSFTFPFLGIRKVTDLSSVSLESLAEAGNSPSSIDRNLKIEQFLKIALLKLEANCVLALAEKYEEGWAHLGRSHMRAQYISTQATHDSTCYKGHFGT